MSNINVFRDVESMMNEVNSHYNSCLEPIDACYRFNISAPRLLLKDCGSELNCTMEALPMGDRYRCIQNKETDLERLDCLKALPDISINFNVFRDIRSIQNEIESKNAADPESRSACSVQNVNMLMKLHCFQNNET